MIDSTGHRVSAHWRPCCHSPSVAGRGNQLHVRHGVTYRHHTTAKSVRQAFSPTHPPLQAHSHKETLERFSKPNIRFGSGRTGSKIVSKFRLTHNRKLRSANRNTIYHTIACPALLLWCLAVENRDPCVPKKRSLSNCASPGDSFCQVLDHS